MSVHVRHEGPVCIVTIDRPEVRNAVDGLTAAALAEAFRGFEADPASSVAVLTGAGGYFCAGADLKAIGEGRGNRVERDIELDGPMGPTRMQLTKPVIAAVEGFAVAGGLELAIWCDLRVAASDAVFGVYCRRWGVPLVDGGTVRLPMGLVNRSVAPGTALATAITLATEIAALPQGCMRRDRQSSYEQFDLPLTAALANETALGLATIMSGETLDGAARFASGAGRHGGTG